MVVHEPSVPLDAGVALFSNPFHVVDTLVLAQVLPHESHITVVALHECLRTRQNVLSRIFVR